MVGEVGQLVALEPCAYNLVGCDLLEVEKRASEVETIVGADICIVATLALSDDGVRGVDLCENALVVRYGFIEALAGCLLMRVLVEVVGASRAATKDAIMSMYIYLCLIGIR